MTMSQAWPLITPPPINTVVTLPHMYSFIFLNVSRLFTKTKLKYTVLSDLCGPSTSFLCLCETFLMDSINDSEIQIPGVSIVRCNRLLREGGGVCIYVRNTKSFSVCLKYANSICDRLIVKLHQPSLIIILMYRPITCPITEFYDIILKTKSYKMSLSSPLPNIIMLVDFNFPNIPDSMLLAVRRWPTGGSASGPLEICPSGSPEDRRWQPP